MLVPTGSSWDDLDPEAVDVVRKAVASGEPITDPGLAPAAIGEAERVRRANRAAWARLIAVALALIGFALFELAGGGFVKAAIAGSAGALLLAFWRWQSPAVRHAAVTRASAEALLQDRQNEG